MEYKENEEKWEAKRATLEEALNHKNNSVLLLERKLRDVNDELVNRSKALKNVESECTRLQQEVEELRKSNESQREEYQATVADWRSRLEKTVERLQRLLENEKKQVQSVVEEWSLKLQEKSVSVTNLEAELARRDELEKTRIFEQCEILRRTHQMEKEEHAANWKRNYLNKRDELICKGREELKGLLIEKERIGNEREEVVNELERTTESLKEARFIMDGFREEIATKFEPRKPFSKLFAANQKLAVCEKERAEWKDIIERMEVREEQAKQKNLELTDEVNRWRRELEGLKEEKVKTQKMVSDYRAELGSKSMELEKISKSLEDSQKNNMLNLQLVQTLKEEYDHKTNMLKHQEKRHVEENEELRSLCIQKEEQMQKALKPYQKENIKLRSEVDSLRKENDNYKVALEQVKPVRGGENIPESSKMSPEEKSPNPCLNILVNAIKGEIMFNMEAMT
ncbi:hypothetical protein COOONC_26856 [Cooperia oncophora]